MRRLLFCTNTKCFKTIALRNGASYHAVDSKVQSAQRTGVVTDEDAAFLQASRMASLGSSVADLIENVDCLVRKPNSWFRCKENIGSPINIL